MLQTQTALSYLSTRLNNFFWEISLIYNFVSMWLYIYPSILCFGQFCSCFVAPQIYNWTSGPDEASTARTETGPPCFRCRRRLFMVMKKWTKMKKVSVICFFVLFFLLLLTHIEQNPPLLTFRSPGSLTSGTVMTAQTQGLHVEVVSHSVIIAGIAKWMEEWISWKHGRA